MWLSCYSPLSTKTPTVAVGVGCCSTTGTGTGLAFHVTSITSVSNPFVKHCVKLRNSSSYRHSHSSVLLIGTTPLREIYDFQQSLPNHSIDCILLHDKAVLPQDLLHSDIRIVRVNSPVLDKLSGLQSTDSVDAVSVVRIPSSFHTLHDQHSQHFSKWFPSASRILVLDGIQDPGNLGTLLRSAVAFGWDGAFLLPGCCDPFNDKALRASRGASFQLPMVSGQWSDLQRLVEGFDMKILAGHPSSDDEKPVACLSHKLVQSLTDKNVCLILGSEGSGLSEKARKVSELVSIRMGGRFESLNVSVAGGIFLFMLQPQNEEV